MLGWNLIVYVVEAFRPLAGGWSTVKGSWLAEKLEGKAITLHIILDGSAYDAKQKYLADKKLWCCQEAIRNIRDEADVVLYLVPADQDPAQAGYVDVKMKILDWIGKPVIVLLNQTGEPKPDRDAAEIHAWRRHLGQWRYVRSTLSLDAFASCWVQERRLLHRVRDALPGEKRSACDDLIAGWVERNLKTFSQAAEILGRWLA